MPQAEQNHFLNMPIWVTLAFCLVCVQMFHAFFISQAFDVYKLGGLIMAILVIIIAIFLVLLSHIARHRAWLN